ncbi:orotate phosphoribosyltransferase [Thermoplasmatales archaeon SG8-52-1]|nr:MAG: orotate phosphoribosyltransferase [Thermoplasmatales archaeon SG8-52-1]
MDLMGLCNICGKPGTMFTCHICGRLVCSNCFDNAQGICNNCKMGKR